MEIYAKVGLTLLLALVAAWFLRRKDGPKSQRLPFERSEAPNGTEEYFPLFGDLSKIDWNLLRIKRAFQVGKILSMKKEYMDDEQKILRPINKTPDVFPIKLKAGANLEDIQGIDWDNITEQQKEHFLSKFESMKVRRVNYSKALAVIYNPNSGNKRNLVPEIEARFLKEGIKFEMLATKKAGDTFNFANEIDFGKYSALVVVGGDGSASEVVNGMLARKDGARLPIGLVGNGSGNVTACMVGASDW